MWKQAQKVIAGVAVLAAVAVGASAVAGAASNNASGSSAKPSANAPRPNGVPPGGHGPGETLLTGDTAAKVRKAAQDKVPGGTILRVETDSDGSPYEAHVRKSDGRQVVVKVDKSFNVTAVQDFPGQGGMRGHPGGSGTGVPSGPPPTSAY